jgi:NADPH-dependent ferric siderophore reductase
MNKMSDQYDERMKPRLIQCVRKAYITPHLLRITFACDEQSRFPVDRDGAHIKLFFANRESGVLALPWRDGGQICWPKHKPVSRAYTARKYHPEKNELDIDFVAHGTDSPGSGWAITCQPGDRIGLAGPGGPEPLLRPADWHILAGDLTAVPAISAILESLPDNARGMVLIEIDHAEDQHVLQHPGGVEIRWLIRDVRQDPLPLVTAIDTIHPPDEKQSMSGFVAGESHSVVACRNKLIANFTLTRKNLYAVPYWHRGRSEEKYHRERHQIMDESY